MNKTSFVNKGTAISLLESETETASPLQIKFCMSKNRQECFLHLC